MKDKIFKIIICFIVLILLPITANAATYYVATTGSDSNSKVQAQSASTPWANPEYAATQVSPGDTVIVKDGTYTDTNGDDYVVSMMIGGTAGNWVTFKSENKWGAVIDGLSNSTNYGIATNANYIRIEGFEIKGVGDTGIISNYGADHMYFYQNLIHDIARKCTNTAGGNNGVYQGSGCNFHTYDSNIIHTIGRYNDGENGCTNGNHYWMNHDHGMYINLNSDTTIINNIFYNNKSGWDIQFARGADNVDIINNTFSSPHNLNRIGYILLYAESGQVCANATIQNNIFYNPNGAAIRSYGLMSNIVVKNNLMYGASTWTSHAGGGSSDTDFTYANNITGLDPLFTDEPNNDYTLQAGSPAIDAGLSTNAPNLDHDGLARPVNSVWDIGAHEYNGAAPSPDTEAPTVPTNLSASAVSQTQIDLSWTASTDNEAVTGYRIFRGSTEINTSPTDSYSDTGLLSGTLYSYTVTAFDAAQNESAQSSSSNATTLSDTTKPTISSIDASVIDTVEVVFSEDLGTGAEISGNYTIDNGISVTNAVFGTDNKTIDLTVSNLSEATTYTLTVNNVQDVAGNTILANSTDTFSFTGNLVVWYKFNEKSGTSISDSSGNGNAGTSTSSVWSAAGHDRYAHEFNGTTDYVTVSDSASLDSITTAMTIIVWVRPTVAQRGIIAEKYYYATGVTDNAWTIDMRADQTTSFSISTDGTSANTKFVSSGDTIPLNQWSVIAARFDGASQEIWNNNVHGTPSVDLTGGINTNNRDMHIGRWFTNGVWYYPFPGRIDELRIYSSALSDDEITNIINYDSVKRTFRGVSFSGCSMR